jgi:hypothetical protein
MIPQKPIGLTQDIDDTFVHGLEQSQQVLDKQGKSSNCDLIAELIHVKLSVQISAIDTSVRRGRAPRKNKQSKTLYLLCS